MKYAIVVCATNNWLPPAAVTLLSCHNQGAGTYADLLIVTPSPTPLHQQQLEKFNARHGTSITLIKANEGQLGTADAGRFSIGSLLRLRLTHHLSSHYEKVLYLDSDVLACAPCRELFEVEMDGKCMAACEDLMLLSMVNEGAQTYRDKIGMALSASYFNAGVMLFDWHHAKTATLLLSADELMIGGKHFPFADQDPLNLCAIGLWKKLPPKFNVDKPTFGFLNIAPVFRHFTGTLKPWNCCRFTFRKYRQYYTKSLKGTDWEDFMLQKQKSILKFISVKDIARRLSFRKRHRLQKYLGLI